MDRFRSPSWFVSLGTNWKINWEKTFIRGVIQCSSGLLMFMLPYREKNQPVKKNQIQTEIEISISHWKNWKRTSKDLETKQTETNEPVSGDWTGGGYPGDKFELLWLEYLWGLASIQCLIFERRNIATNQPSKRNRLLSTPSILSGTLPPHPSLPPGHVWKS